MVARKIFGISTIGDTGPHLRMNGVHMNPQTVRLPGAEPLRDESLHKFLSTATPLLGSLAPMPMDPAGSLAKASAN
jgi:hypothetical protein